MARTPEGWKLVWKRGIAHVRFRLRGRRHTVTTCQRDPGKAAEVAGQIYADFVSGRVRRASSGALVHPATPLDEICAEWIADIEPELGQGTDSTYEVYARHWCKHFESIGNVNVSAIGSYQRERLKSVQRPTVVKERSALRRFLTWCVEKGYLGDVPEFPPLAKKAPGTRHRQGRRKPLVDLTPAEVEAILAALPAWSQRRRKGERFPVRPYFVFAYETGLRPEGTIDRLLGGDVTLAGLHIRPECDKNRWERVVPLTERARAAVASVGALGDHDPIFGVHDRRAAFRRACAAALGEQRGKLVTPYDLKHARVTHLVDAGAPATGITFLTGTEAALDRYVHPTRRAAEQAIGFNSGSVSVEKECEGEDLNLHGSYPASTSSEIASENPEEIESSLSRDPAANATQDPDSGSGDPNPSALILVPALEALALAAESALRPRRRVFYGTLVRKRGKGVA